VLLEESLEPMGLSQYRLAKDISVPPLNRRTGAVTASGAWLEPIRPTASVPVAIPRSWLETRV
jgi:hypothetical protein